MEKFKLLIDNKSPKDRFYEHVVGAFESTINNDELINYVVQYCEESLSPIDITDIKERLEVKTTTEKNYTISGDCIIPKDNRNGNRKINNDTIHPVFSGEINMKAFYKQQINRPK